MDPRERHAGVYEPLLFHWRKLLVSVEYRLPATVRHVGLTLSLHMDMDGGGAFPSITRLSHETGRKRQTVIDALRTLEGFGFLEIERGGIGRGKRSSRYAAKSPDGYLGKSLNGHLHAEDVSASAGTPKGASSVRRKSPARHPSSSRAHQGTPSRAQQMQPIAIDEPCSRCGSKPSIDSGEGDVYCPQCAAGKAPTFSDCADRDGPPTGLRDAGSAFSANAVRAETQV